MQSDKPEFCKAMPPELYLSEPTTPAELAADRVARTVRDAFLATAELGKLRLDPITAPLVAKEESEIWAIQSRISSLLHEIRGSHAV
jgi:hypothetical protein